MGNWPKKEGACPKRETDTDRLQEITKIGHRLQTLLIGYKSLVIDYKRLQKSDLDYKVYWQTTKDYKSQT